MSDAAENKDPIQESPHLVIPRPGVTFEIVVVTLQVGSLEQERSVAIDLRFIPSGNAEEKINLTQFLIDMDDGDDSERDLSKVADDLFAAVHSQLNGLKVVLKVSELRDVPGHAGVSAVTKIEMRTPK